MGPEQPRETQLDPTRLERGFGFAAGGAWGASTCKDDKATTCWEPMEPINPGMTPGTDKPRIILGIDVDYPPYGTLGYVRSARRWCARVIVGRTERTRT